ncbi:MAG: hypothetical protein F4139_16170 [Gemmatimonadetes bacterium]|nr:hypothetical protein [Gemmatimonadota bacterium]MYA63808.1 hypothetical protein [Gemmatimonadota bacterium]MYB97471.1 hypothetical protein [Gemmatimonadota bacterium]MYH54451.1 hypothetical protein [Gemmatimonadota bacterium]MYI45129.1 hypothetical protein [Gemmatimonadota bacterium]
MIGNRRATHDRLLPPHGFFPAALILTATLATACSPDSGSISDASSAVDVTATIDTIDGVVRVANTGTPPEWQLTRIASIGPKSVNETGSPEEFGGVYDVAIGPDESVYVTDGLNNEVRVFGLDGSHRFTFGRSGEGPGEFARAYSVVWLGDRLLALDTEQGRISEFTAQGEYLGQRRIQGGMSGGPGWPRFWRVDADEAYYFTRALEPAPGRWSEFAGVDSRGETGDTVVQLAGPRATITCEPSRDRTSFFDIPFGAELVQRPGPGGMLYSAITGAYRIALSDADDDTVMVIERELAPEPISDDEWATGNSRYRAVRDTFPLMRCDPLRPPRPDAKPFIEAIDIAYDGRLWVEVIREAGNRWEVFDTDGRLLATLPSPVRGSLAPAISADHVLTVRRDDLGLDHVDVWRIERGS